MSKKDSKAKPVEQEVPLEENEITPEGSKWEAFQEVEDPVDDDPSDEDTLAEKASALSYDELVAALHHAKQALKTNEEALVRMKADFVNAQRRAERDIANAHQFGLERFVRDLLPVVDNLERCLEIPVDTDKVVASLREGVELTLKSFMASLEKMGVEQINPLHEPFSSEFHEAVSMAKDPEAKSGTILNVMQKGYLLQGRLLRPAMVVVASD